VAATLKDIPAGATAVVALGTIPKGVPGSRYSKRVRLTGDTSYPTGGYAVTAANFGFAVQIDYLEIINQLMGATNAGYQWGYNTVTQKLQLFVQSSAAEVTAATDVHDYSCDVVATGY
jgi:hypothetical protein